MQTKQNRNARHASEVMAVKRWLFELPALDPEQNVSRIHESLKTHNAHEMTVQARLELLDCYQEPIALLIRDLQKHRVGLMLPLPRTSLKTADLIRKLFQEYAQGYLIVVGAITENTDTVETDPDREFLIKSCYGATLSLSQILRCSYESYRTPPPDVWKQLHAIFRLALRHEIEAEEFDDSSDVLTSICNEYKRALLLGLSEPYQLPFRTVNLVFDQLQLWSTQALLFVEINKASRSGCLFIVDVESDRPAVPCISSMKIQDRERDLILDTSPLVNALNCQLKTMTTDTVTDPGIEVTDFEYIETLKALITHWRVHPMRRTQRSASQTEYSIILGLTNICRELSDDTETTQSAVNLSNSGDMLRGTFGQQQYLKANSRILPQPWKTIDESPNGIRFRVATSDRAQVRVGELIAFRPAASKPAWTAGVVRWARESADNTVDFGVYKLGGGTIPVNIRLASEKDQDTPSKDYTGLFLPADPSIRREQTLIVLSGLYGPRRQLWLWSKGTDYIVEATNLILAGRPFDWFEIRTNRGYGLNRDADYNTVKPAKSVYCPL